MNNKRRGTYYEHRAIEILEAAGYVCTRAGGSLGAFDVIAIGPRDVRCVQVKGGERNYLSAVEREQLVLLAVPPNCTKECWRFVKHARAPLIEQL